jgi:hypothetical protein
MITRSSVERVFAALESNDVAYIKKVIKHNDIFDYIKIINGREHDIRHMSPSLSKEMLKMLYTSGKIDFMRSTFKHQCDISIFDCLFFLYTDRNIFEIFSGYDQYRYINKHVNKVRGTSKISSLLSALMIGRLGIGDILLAQDMGFYPNIVQESECGHRSQFHHEYYFEIHNKLHRYWTRELAPLFVLTLAKIGIGVGYGEQLYKGDKYTPRVMPHRIRLLHAIRHHSHPMKKVHLELKEKYAKTVKMYVKRSLLPLRLPSNVYDIITRKMVGVTPTSEL